MLADMLTIQEHLGHIKGVKLVYYKYINISHNENNIFKIKKKLIFIQLYIFNKTFIIYLLMRIIKN